MSKKKIVRSCQKLKRFYKKIIVTTNQNELQIFIFAIIYNCKIDREIMQIYMTRYNTLRLCMRINIEKTDLPVQVFSEHCY